MSTVDADTPDPIIHGKPLSFSAGSHIYEWGGQRVPSVTTVLSSIAKPALVQWAANQAIEHVKRNGTLCTITVQGPARLHRMIDTTKRGARAIAAEMRLEHGQYALVRTEEIENARKAHARTRDEAGDIGTQLHDFAKNTMRGFALKMPDHPIAINAAKGYMRWYRRHHCSNFQLERRSYSLRDGVAGTPDFFGEIDGELGVLDYKTGNGVYREHWLQLTAYKRMIEEERGVSGLRRWIAHLNKETGTFHLLDDGDRDDALDNEAWEGILGYFKATRRMPPERT